MQNHLVVVVKGIKDAPVLFKGTDAEVVNWLKAQSDVSGYEILDMSEGNRLSVKNFLVASEALKFAPKHYRMNPKTDDIIPNGRQLKNGMRVLIEDSDKRVNVDGELQVWEEEKALKTNRWCVVQSIEWVGNQVHFIGVYDDGTKMKRAVTDFYAWLVKIDSLEETNVRETQIENFVIKAMSDAIIINSATFSLKEKEKELGKVVQHAVRKIQGLL